MKRLINYHIYGIVRMLLFALACTSVSFAYADDFGLWTEAGVDKGFGKKFGVGSEIGFRINDNLGSFTRFDLGFSANYKPMRGLKFSTGYIFIDQHNPREVKTGFNKEGAWNGFNVDHNYWRLKHRIYIDATGKIDVGRFTFSLRERYQLTFYQAKTVTRDRYRGIVQEDYDGEKLYGEYDGQGRWYAYNETAEDRKAAKTKHYLRSRIGVEWNIRHCPVDPFATFEISNNLGKGFALDKRRWTLGADWKITKQHTLTAAYVYTNGNDDDDENNLHAISIGYKYKF